MRKFRRVNEDAKLFGVCGGLAYMLEMPSWLVRLLVACSVLFLGVGLLAYILVGLFAPQWDTDPADYKQVVDSSSNNITP